MTSFDLSTDLDAWGDATLPEDVPVLTRLMCEVLLEAYPVRAFAQREHNVLRVYLPEGTDAEEAREWATHEGFAQVLRRWCPAGGEHTWSYHSPALDGPCAPFTPGRYCDECGAAAPAEVEP
jgi:hypothetical protein